MLFNQAGEEKVKKKLTYDELYNRVKQLEYENKQIKSEFQDNLSECTARYDFMLNTVEAHMSLVDRDMNIIWANRNAKRIFGSDIIGKPCFHACHGKNKPCRDSSMCIAKKAFRHGQVKKHEAEAMDGSGRKMFFSGSARVISRDSDGTPLAVVRIYNDITEQKKTEQELKQSMLQLRKNLTGTVQAMAMTVETRDPYTAGHQRRTSDIARGIAQKMGLPGKQVDGIRMAGVIHDLGKISVPAEILSKPGDIGQSEFSLIKHHPQTGYTILKGIDFRWPVAEIVRQHHERMDGSGYPYGLSGEDILMEARVIGVADVIEAMSSHRPYRPALGIDKAFDEIVQHKGELYDADVVDAAVELYTGKQFDFAVGCQTFT
jgi:PAS domain S-box-containing protein